MAGMYRCPDFPDQVCIELTNMCNARCTICATPSMRRKKQIMHPDLFSKIVDECARRRVRNILPAAHGESLLVPGVLDYFRYIRKACPGTHVNLTTNGSKLSEDLSEAFLTENLLDSLIVSFDGADRETFERIRLGLSFEEVRKNVLHFLKRRKQLGKREPKVWIAMVSVPENSATRAGFADLWKDADEVRYSVYFNWGGKLENRWRSSNRVNFCERMYYYMTILVDGRVALCCFDSEADHAVGDVSNQGLHEVWNSPEFSKKRSLLYSRDFSKLTLCARCDFINHPAWMMPLIRFRPYVRIHAPVLAQAADRLYKRWLIR
jgi:radical SAM protein with 4Fe4S-binding SPASM domain